MYRITVFFCGANFCDVTTKHVHAILRFLFCNVTPWQFDFYSLDEIKNLLVNPKHSSFVWVCTYILKSRSFFALLITSIHPSRHTCVSRMFTSFYEHKVITREMTKVAVSHSSLFDLRKLGSCVFTTVSRKTSFKDIHFQTIYPSGYRIKSYSIACFLSYKCCILNLM